MKYTVNPVKQQDSKAQPKHYDLYLAANPIHEVSVIIKHVADQQGKLFEQRLADMMQNDVQVKVRININQDLLDPKSDDEHFRCWINSIESQPKFSVLSIDKNVPRSIMDLICGGTGKPSSAAVFTELSVGENKIVGKMADIFLDCIYESLKASVPLRLRVSEKADGMAADLKFKGLRHHLVSTVYTIITPSFSGDLTLTSPTNNLRSYAIDDADNHGMLKEKLIANLAAVPLPVTAILSNQESTLRKIVALQPGDILPLDSNMCAEVFIGKKPLCEAKVFSSGSKLMLKVENENPLEDSEDEGENVEKNGRRQGRGKNHRRSTKDREPIKAVTRERKRR
ncbi:hypothetical protein ACH42_04640 [Endozoicomonas sp. (ex Bugula neritina AB1)]|nr:hypothetical protein ACH42_04640 [Endozoicomonas sp. (ex Bugula neritina AB1)]